MRIPVIISGQIHKESLRPIADEIRGAVNFIVDHGAIELGTPQSKRLIQTLVKLQRLAGTPPAIPDDYPRSPNPGSASHG